MADRDGARRGVERDTSLRSVWLEFEHRWIIVPLGALVFVAFVYFISILPGMAT